MEDEAKLDTYPKLLLHAYQNYPDKIALRQKIYGIWNEQTWAESYHIAECFALGLVSLGLKPGERVAILGDEEPEGFLAILAVQSVHGIALGMWADSAESEALHILENSNSVFVVVEDQEQVDKILDIKEGLPLLRKVICWDQRGLRKYDDPILMTFKAVLDMGEKYEKDNPGAFEKYIAQGDGDDMAVFAYTSGTTGLPKGAMITHKATIQNAKVWFQLADVGDGDDVLTLIPLGHTFFEQWFAGVHYLGLSRMHFPEEPETVMEDYREISPKVLVLTPRQWQGIASTIQVKVGDSSRLKKTIFDLFLPVGHKMVDLRSSNESPNTFWRALHSVGEMAVFRPLKDKVGMVRTRYPITGSSNISPDVLRFFSAIGICLRQVYAGTEAGVVAGHRDDDINMDTVGVLPLKVEVRISKDGEVMIRSEGIFSGYHNEPEKTKEVLCDGWFLTGDAGYFDEASHLVFTDRVSDLSKLKSGHNYAPGHIEAKLRFGRFIEEVLVIGDEDKEYISALVNIDFATVGKWAEDHRVVYTTFVDLSQKEEVAEIVGKDIERVNKSLPEDSRIKKYVLLHKEFDPDEAEMTRSRKVRRKAMATSFANIIEAIYGDRTEAPVEAQVKYRDGRSGTVSTTLRVRSVD